jgi:hypothetical protein
VSVPVELDALDLQIDRFGPRALLVTTAADGPPHVSSVLVTRAGAALGMNPGRKTRANVAERPAVTLVWTAAGEDEFCLIVDGMARVDASEALLVAPTSAILHRLAVGSR